MNTFIEQVVRMVTSFGPWLIGAILILRLGFKITWKVEKIIKSGLQKSNIERSLSKFLASLLSFVIKGLLVITAAGMIGVETTSFVAILWAAWLAIGLALQWSLANFAGGVLILLFKPYKVGDYIHVQGQEGTVEDINIFTSKLITPEQKEAIIPNGSIANNNIINFTAQKIRRVDITVGIAYDEDIDETRKVLEKVIEENKYTLENSNSGVFVSELADSSVNLIVRWFAPAREYWNAFFSLTEESKKALDKANISIPFPHRVVHTVSWTKNL